MKKLLKNARVVNVFTDSVDECDVLIEDGLVVGLDRYEPCEADECEDLQGRFVCPAFIDGHIHIESTMLMPWELARVCVPHGTCAIVADPHEIANVMGLIGISFMIEGSEKLPMETYFMLPSCVPATPFDESGDTLFAEDLRPFYKHPRVLGLAEMMNYPGVLAGVPEVMQKIEEAKAQGAIINGHAPLLSGKDLDRYITAGAQDDHECSNFEEAAERIRKGQWLMIRQGTSARNLEGLIGLFAEPYNRRCLLVTDDKHPADLLQNGHIDAIIRQAVALGQSPLVAIRMASLQAAQCFGLYRKGAVAPGYEASLLVLDDLDTVAIRDVYFKGELVSRGGQATSDFAHARINAEIWKSVANSMFCDAFTPEQFILRAPEGIDPEKALCRIISLIPGQLLTDEAILPVDLTRQNGIDTERDILKLAVCERHMNTGHIGLGFIRGIGLKKGAIAATVSHDSHNLILIGQNEADMAAAANRVRELRGGSVFVADGRVVSEMPLPMAGLMSTDTAVELAAQNETLRRSVYGYGVPENIEPFMSMAFVSLPVIPSLKMTTQGLVNVNEFKRVPLFVEA